MCSNYNIIHLHFSASECNGWPKVRISIDDVLISTVEIKQPQLVVPIQLPIVNNKEHTLTIEMFDKNETNTVISDNQIIKDQLLELADIQVDNIVLPEYHKYNGTFHYNNCSVPSMTKWGFNGEFCWKFKTPLLPWLVDAAENHRYQYGIASTLYVDAKKSILLDKLSNFINLLDEQKNL